jgi:hypothetical protein
MLRAQTDFRDNFVTRAFKAEFEAIGFETTVTLILSPCAC